MYYKISHGMVLLTVDKPSGEWVEYDCCVQYIEYRISTDDGHSK